MITRRCKNLRDGNTSNLLIGLLFFSTDFIETSCKSSVQRIDGSEISMNQSKLNVPSGLATNGKTDKSLTIAKENAADDMKSPKQSLDVDVRLTDKQTNNGLLIKAAIEKHTSVSSDIELAVSPNHSCAPSSLAVGEDNLKSINAHASQDEPNPTAETESKQSIGLPMADSHPKDFSNTVNEITSMIDPAPVSELELEELPKVGSPSKSSEDIIVEESKEKAAIKLKQLNIVSSELVSIGLMQPCEKAPLESDEYPSTSTSTSTKMETSDLASDVEVQTEKNGQQSEPMNVTQPSLVSPVDECSISTVNTARALSGSTLSSPIKIYSNSVAVIAPNDSSPEGIRAAAVDEIVSPPPTIDQDPISSNILNNDAECDQTKSHTPPIDNELLIDEEQNITRSCTTPCSLEIKDMVDDLVGITVAKIDGNPVTNVRTHRASPHVSPCNSDDEGADLALHDETSATEISDEDCDRHLNAKRPRLAITPASTSVGGCRLNKVRHNDIMTYYIF